jgi:hypothetical protein
MNIVYSWEISALECYPNFNSNDNVVFMVHWRRKATDSKGPTAEVYGAQKISIDLTKPFTPFNELTKTQVEKWLVDNMTVGGVAAIDAGLHKQIEDQLNPPTITLVSPWGTN